MTDAPITNALWPALLRARQSIQRIPKSAENPHFKSAYTPLEDILAAVLPALHAEGLALASYCEADPPALLIDICEVVTGQGIRSRVPLIGCTDMQKLGGAMTYAARYGIANLLGLELEGTDDDGNTASAAATRAASAPPRRDPAPASPRAQGSARPASKPAGKHPDPEPQDNDEEAVWDLARALDQHSEDTGQKFRIVKGEKLGLFGKIADRVGVGAGNHAPSDLNPLQLARLRNFYEYLCKQNDIPLPSSDLPF